MHKADFERLLSTRSQGRSAHFALHHLMAVPQAAGKASRQPRQEKLSTEAGTEPAEPVDNTAEADAPEGHWLGCMVPKRHARRAVTRNLIKRQMRAGFERHAGHLPPGLWLLRLHAGYPVAEFPSARSDALAAAARGELDRLLNAAAARAASR